jgi:UMF1 family MFS transporter
VIAHEKKKQIISWALYDWANSAYAVTVMSVFFPLFFKQYWGASLSSEESTYQLGLANSIASLTIVVLAPVLGSIADQSAARKRFLFLFTFLGVSMCAGLFFVAQGSWLIAVIVYVLACVGFMGGVSFSDSLLVYVAPENKLDSISALGYALGYIGGGLLFAVCVWMVQSPHSFALSDASTAIRLSFLLVSLWWLLFSIPVFIWVKEPAALSARPTAGLAVMAGVQQLVSTFYEIRKLKIVFTFLLAYWLYIDGVDTIIRMAVDYGLSLNIESSSLIIAILITQFIGFPSAIFFGYLGEKIGPKAGIMIALAVYISVVIWATQIDSAWEFYVLAILIGLVQGGVQSLSRSLFARIIPKNRSAEFFGFYNMLGKFAAVLGPFLVGGIALLTGSHRIAMLSIIILFIAGGLLLRSVDIKEGMRLAKDMDAT